MKTGKENQYMTHRGSQIWVSNFSLENTGAKNMLNMWENINN